MDTPAVISLTGSFLKFVGETLADVKREELGKIDLDLLALKRSQLAEKLDDFKTQLERAVTQEKARAQQDLISRGLAASSILGSTMRDIERDASDELDKASREYNRAIEEIALLERRVKEQVCPWWKKLFRKR